MYVYSHHSAPTFIVRFYLNNCFNIILENHTNEIQEDKKNIFDYKNLFIKSWGVIHNIQTSYTNMSNIAEIIVLR